MKIRVDELSDEAIRDHLIGAGYSVATATAATDVYRQVQLVLLTGAKAPPRSGWTDFNR